jgi:hypothetical protein
LRGINESLDGSDRRRPSADVTNTNDPRSLKLEDAKVAKVFDIHRWRYLVSFPICAFRVLDARSMEGSARDERDVEIVLLLARIVSWLP